MGSEFWRIYILMGLEIIFVGFAILTIFRKYVLPQKRLKAYLTEAIFLLILIVFAQVYYKIIITSYLVRLIASFSIVILCVWITNAFIDIPFNKVIIFLFLIKTISDNCKYVVDILYEIIHYYHPETGLEIHFICLIGIYAVSAVLIYIATQKIFHPMIDCSIDPKVWQYLWYIPVLLYIIFRSGIKSYDKSIYVIKSIPLLTAEFIWIVGNIFIYGIIFKMLLKVAEDTEMERELTIANMQLDMQKEQYEGLKKNITAIRQAQHDLRHILIAMREYVDTQDYEGLSQYLNAYTDIVSQPAFERICDNYAVDSIMNYYLRAAKENEIRTNIRCDIPKQIPIQETEFCIVLGNLFENAIEACIRMKQKEKRYIDITCCMHQKNAFVIIVKNSCEGNPEREEGIFLSSKRKGTGIGVESVKSIVKKYNGTIKIEPSPNVFYTSVLLNF